MTGAGYAQSARLAAVRGPFAGFEVNRGPMLGVMESHRRALRQVDSSRVPLGLMQACRDYPERDDQNFLYHTLAYRTDDGPRMDKKEVKLGHWEPQERKY